MSRVGAVVVSASRNPHVLDPPSILAALTSAGADVCWVRNEIGKAVGPPRCRGGTLTLPNVGYGTAAMLGFARGSFDWLLIANDDVVISDAEARRIVTHLQGRPGPIGAVGFRLLDATDKSEQRSRVPIPGIGNLALILLGGESFALKRTTRWYPKGAFVAVRRAALEEVGGFDPRFFLYFEETDLFTRLVSGGWKIASAPADLTVEHIGGRTTADFETLMKQELGWSTSTFVRKHFFGPRRILAMLLFRSIYLRTATASMARGDGSAARAWLSALTRTFCADMESPCVAAGLAAPVRERLRLIGLRHDFPTAEDGI